jgi:effector-binding domain-containing protein
VSSEKSAITHKRLDDMLVASLRFQMCERDELFAKLDELRSVCQEYTAGPAFAVFYWDTGLEGIDTEACLPVSQPVEGGGIRSRMLEGEEVFSILHRGSHENLADGYRAIGGQLLEHGLNAENKSREIYLALFPASPDANLTEIQVSFVNWEKRLAENLDRALAEDASRQILRGIEQLPLQSTRQERIGWVKGAMERLDAMTDEGQKFDILSRCAHVFSPSRIERLRAIYERNQDVDEVLAAMHEDPDWYEDPTRAGSIIHVTKIPRDAKGYEEAADESQKRTHYCHCALVRLTPSDIPPTFCYCGAGWYRQIWEGIIGEPVRVEMTKSLTRGDGTCEFAIHLPLRVGVRQGKRLKDQT